MISELRNLKIRLLNGDIKLSFSEKAIKKYSKELNFIGGELEKDDIITGSLCLALYGLIDRDISDIDIIIKNKNRYKNYRRYGYGNDNDIPNRLGYKEISKKYKLWYIFKKKLTYQVDFFENTGNHSYSILNYSGYKLRVDNPIQVMQLKNSLHNPQWISSSIKHREDLVKIIHYFNSN